MSTELSFHWQIGDESVQTGRYDGYDNLDGAILRAYTEARRSGLPVTVIRADGPDTRLRITPLCVISPPVAPEEASP